MVYCVLVVCGMRLQGWLRHRTFAALAERSSSLIVAIEQFERAHGAPPTSLDELVPEYSANVPSTGVPAYPRYEFTSRVANARWELRVQCPLGLMNWDVFFYWPGTDYPNAIYGGSVERIGGWAYVHE
jgi:hypothetical protein